MDPTRDAAIPLKDFALSISMVSELGTLELPKRASTRWTDVSTPSDDLRRQCFWVDNDACCSLFAEG